MKKNICLCLCFVLILVHVNMTCSHAVSNFNDYNLCYFYLGHTEQQSRTFYDNAGNKITLSVTYTPVKHANNTKDNVTNGVYTISASSPYLSLSYKVLITSYSIMSVYDGQFTSSLYTISNPSLVRESLKEAKYSVTCNNSFIQFTKWLKCQINSSNELVITNNL